MSQDHECLHSLLRHALERRGMTDGQSDETAERLFGALGEHLAAFLEAAATRTIFQIDHFAGAGGFVLNNVNGAVARVSREERWSNGQRVEVFKYDLPISALTDDTDMHKLRDDLDAARMQAEEDRRRAEAAKAREERERQERAEFERLRAKYGA